MNKDQVKGRAEEAAGKIKEVAGRSVGNKELEARGSVEKTEGKFRKTYGDVKEEVKKDLKKP